MIIRSVTEGDTSRWRGDDVHDDDDDDDDESRLSLGSMRSTCLCVCAAKPRVKPPFPLPGEQVLEVLYKNSWHSF